MPFHPGDHAEHDLLVVALQHQRVTIAEDAVFRQHVDRHITTQRLHFRLEGARRLHPVLRPVANHDEDRDLRQNGQFGRRDGVKSGDRTFNRQNALDLVGALDGRQIAKQA